jgi:peptidoglycan/xylan/chitin deacetylase (PgdA/CDA1 family)
MIGLRFDIDSNYGLTRRVNPLLKLLDRHGLKATFFCVMGPDPSIYEIIGLRFFGNDTPRQQPLEHEGMRMGLKSRNFHALKILYTLAYPRKVGTAHSNILRELVAQGHEVFPHGWSHIQWQRNLGNIDIRKHLDLCIESHASIFSAKPAGFAAPGRRYSDRSLALLDEAGFAFSGDMDGNKPFFPEGRSCMQIPVTLFVTIGEFRAMGLNDSQILDRYVNHIAEREFAVLYEHPDNLHDRELAILDGFYECVRRNNEEVLTFSQIYEKFRTIAV